MRDLRRNECAESARSSRSTASSSVLSPHSDSTGADSLVADAQALEEAGAFSVVLEAIPAALARRVTESLSIPTIGIGAGPYCDGQVLVLYDLLGLFDDFMPKFVRPYAHLKADALQALRRYKEEVEQQKFPSESESYQ